MSLPDKSQRLSRFKERQRKEIFYASKEFKEREKERLEKAKEDYEEFLADTRHERALTDYFDMDWDKNKE